MALALECSCVPPLRGTRVQWLTVETLFLQGRERDVDEGLIIAEGHVGLRKCGVVGRGHGVGVRDSSHSRAGRNVQRGNIQTAGHGFRRSGRDGGGHSHNDGADKEHLDWV